MRLRWVAIAGVAIVLVMAGPLLEQLPSGSLLGLTTVTVALMMYNVALAVLGPWRSRFLGRFPTQTVVDSVALAGLIHFAGGVENPFLPLFVLHVVCANIVLTNRLSHLALGVALVLIAAIVVGEGAGYLAHYCLRGDGVACTGNQLGSYSLAVIGALGLTLTASALLTRALTARLRSSQNDLAETVDELQAERRKQAMSREAIEQERSRLQALIDGMNDAVIFSDREGRVVLSNRRARQLWPTLTFSGEPQSVARGPISSGVLAGLLSEAIADGVPGGPTTFSVNDRTFERTHALLPDGQRHPLGLVVVARDITERLEMEHRLMQEERMSVVGKLAATVAHEINNPIGVVSLYSQHALAKVSADSPIRNHLQTILRNADGCRKIVGELLTLARPRPPERKPLDLRALCLDVEESVAPLARRNGVRLVDHRTDAGHPPLWMQGDPDQLRQAVLNLALNAIEASDNGCEVSIDASTSTEPEHPTAAIEVRNSGAVIDESAQGRIFQPFFTTKPTGTGLGLTVAQNVVKGHDGRLEVESTRERGTVFRITIPMAVVPTEAPTDATSWTQPGGLA